MNRTSPPSELSTLQVLAWLGDEANRSTDIARFYSEATARLAAALGAESVALFRRRSNGTLAVTSASTARDHIGDEGVQEVVRTGVAHRGQDGEDMGLCVAVGSSPIFGALGVFGLGRSPTPEDVAFVEIAADQLGAVAARIRALRTLLDSERRLADLVIQSPDPVLTLDMSSTVTASNPAADGLLGAGTVGRSVAEAFGLEPKCSGTLKAAIAEVAMERRAQLVELTVHPDGASTRIVEANVGVIVEGQTPTGLQLVLRDISARRELERQKESLRESQARRHRLEALGRLAGGIAHDFNNLLTVILNNAALLKMVPRLAARELQLAEDTVGAAKRGASLTRQLLTFASSQLSERRPVRVDQVIVELSRLLERVLNESVVLDLWLNAGDEGIVLMDPSQLEQVMLNLAVNARDAMPGGGRLTVRTTVRRAEDTDYRDVEGGEWVLIDVVDTGIGLEPKARDRIFDPFFSTKSSDRGTGLGLAIVHGVITRSGGHVEVESEPGRGTEFRIYLPKSTDTTKEGRADSSEGSQAHAGATLLVVDDDPSVLRVCSLVLKAAGYDVLEADGPRAALARAAELGEEIALLVTDVIMPGMSGPELARRLSSSIPSLQVLFTSGYPGSALEDHGFDESAQLLSKPYSPDSLLRLVDQLLQARADKTT